jgi:Spy/CpxP family protein refolding chaperone
MRLVVNVILATVLVLPGLAIAQVALQAPPPSGEVSSAWTLLAHGPGGFPPPPAPGGPHIGGPEGAPPFGPPPGHGLGPGPGPWWKNTEIVARLGLSPDQVSRIDQTFLEHRLRLVDLRAELEKLEIGLQPLLDAERPEEAKVAAQIDLIAAARGRLEKEHVLSLLAIRRVLGVEQWKKLQALHQERGAERGRPGELPPPPDRGAESPTRPGAPPAR